MSAFAGIPGDGPLSIDAFRRLLEQAAQPADADSPVRLSDTLVGEAWGGLLRQCAVPHSFDAELLAWIGGLDAATAEEQYTRFADLSLMQYGDGTLSMHDHWRSRLWQWWLAPEQQAAFVALNEKLVEWFTRPADPSGEDPAARRRMFHLLGCRHAEGKAEFDRLFRAARHRRRFSECLLLVGLVREYTPRLSAAERAQLDYHEGKVALDLRQWERALPLLRAAADAGNASDGGLAVNAQARIGNALRQLGRNDEAGGVLKAALQRTGPQAEASRWRVQYELGELERDLGNLEAAEGLLSRALDACRDGNCGDIAGILNSLGTVQLKRRDATAAAASFQASLQHLQQAGDALRPGTVLNNLALAQIECCDWPAADAALHASLAIKRTVGDLLGQATTLLNLARVQAAQGRAGDAVQSADEATMLFERAGDARQAAFARQARERLAAPEAGDNARKSMPWWGWGLIVLGLLLVLLIAIAEE